jgi:hypothetical protein
VYAVNRTNPVVLTLVPLEQHSWLIYLRSKRMADHRVTADDETVYPDLSGFARARKA